MTVLWPFQVTLNQEREREREREVGLIQKLQKTFHIAKCVYVNCTLVKLTVIIIWYTKGHAHTRMSFFFFKVEQ